MAKISYKNDHNNKMLNIFILYYCVSLSFSNTKHTSSQSDVRGVSTQNRGGACVA